MRIELTEWKAATALRAPEKTPHSSVESEPDHFSALTAANSTNWTTNIYSYQHHERVHLRSCRPGNNIYGFFLSYWESKRNKVTCRVIHLKSSVNRKCVGSCLELMHYAALYNSTPLFFCWLYDRYDQKTFHFISLLFVSNGILPHSSALPMPWLGFAVKSFPFVSL